MPDDTEIIIQPLPDFLFDPLDAIVGYGGDLFGIIHATIVEESGEDMPAFAVLHMDSLWWANPKNLEEHEANFGKNKEIRNYLVKYKNEVDKWCRMYNILPEG